MSNIREANCSTRAGTKVLILTDILLTILQVFISYCDTTLPKASRQQVLTDTYNFTCTCDACTENKVTVDPRLSLECPKSCGGRCSLPVQGKHTVDLRSQWLIRLRG